MDEAEIAGMPNVRAYWTEGKSNPVFQQDILRSIRDEPPGLFERSPEGAAGYSGLAISGGGSNGAFGAGVICGWTASGTRPVLKLVTGVSTGALIAPYAFLGPDYDGQLKRAYTTISTEDVSRVGKRPPWSSEALYDTAPLAELIARDVNDAMLADIVEAHEQGRRLYMGTVNLDIQRFVVWNMGAIAASGHPDALSLFRDVMLASASIPGAFPPVYIEVEVDGQGFDEMHVDGGTIAQVFFHEFMLDIREAAKEKGSGAGTGSQGEVFLIRNGKFSPSAQQVPRNAMAIANRALSTMTRSASINDLMRIQAKARDDRLLFNYVEIPGDFEYQSKEIFDPEVMNALFDLGFELAESGKAWRRKLPFASD